MITTKYLACPTGIVEAPVGVVWQLLTNIAGWGSFFDVRVTSVDPQGLAAKGQRMLGETGPRWLHLGVCFEYTLVDALYHKLVMNATLPLGITVREAMDEGRCRVNYHCQFGFSDGWRGRLLRALLNRGLQTGPADSLRRLKIAAEQAQRGHKAENGES